MVAQFLTAKQYWWQISECTRGEELLLKKRLPIAIAQELQTQMHRCTGPLYSTNEAILLYFRPPFGHQVRA